MNDDIDGAPQAAGSSRRRTVALAAAVGVAGLVAGGLSAGAISAASAESGASGASGYDARGYGARPPGDPSKPMRGDEKLLTGATKAKVEAAVKAKYPDATIQRSETDSEGVYEAHIVDDGTPLVVLLDKDFTITGTRTGGGPGGPGGCDGDSGPGRGAPGGPGGAGGEQGSDQSQPPAAPPSGGTSPEFPST